MLVHAPPGTPAVRPPLVVLLHGCGQDVAGFAADSGWLALSERLGAPLLLPEQIAENNRGRCFNWFRPADTRRGRGEALSVRQMVADAVRRFGCDPRSVFVLGLSAGGAMAAALLAAYPDLFAGGAVVAGLPVGCAATVQEALSRMSSAGPSLSAEAWAERARAAAPVRFAGPWPGLSIWHGLQDRTVDPANAINLARQWTALHGLTGPPGSDARPRPGVRHQAWGDPARPAVELWTLDGLGHGFPVDAARPGCGRAAPWMLDCGLCAAGQVAQFWGIGPDRA
jgi:poly(hydroxyalkanoate) depolymerase family esterase